jgi:putative endonuclease
MYEAIQRERRLKKRNRAWKIRLIEQMNPDWVPAFAGTTSLDLP